VPAPGDRLSHFRLLEKIGEGGAGDVWKAVDTKLERPVAVKILPRGLAGDPERLARFTGEAKAVAALSHPNIVTIFSVEEAEGLHFLAMELVQGKTLGELVTNRGVPLRQFFDLALPIADAIHAAHERGITHGDLKPNNIMIGDDGRVKILDFGLARFGDDHAALHNGDLQTQTLTQEGRIRGTVPYMSPEQAKGKSLDRRSDVFSLGVVFYELATGRRPFRGETAADIIAAILRDRPRPVNEMISSLPPKLGRIIGRCLEKEPARRYATLADLRRELEELRLEVLSGASLAEAPGGPREATAPRSLAVLPLQNLSGDPEQEFFADGMTDALITGLAKIGALKVISRTSVMRYKGANKPLDEIAAELGVDAVIEGSILRAGNRVRISAQLIDASTDEHLWAESYERELQDVLTLQSEVARAIAAQIEVKLSAPEQARLTRARTVDPAAHEAYLRGRHFWYKRTPDAVRRGLESFQRAIELDPAYASAWAGVADSYLVDGGSYLGVAAEQAYGLAREAAQKAVELDDDLAEAHTSLAGVLDDFDWAWEAAEREYLRAIELNPNYVTARNWYADHLVRMGRHDEAVHEARRAQAIDPLSLTSNFILAWVLFFARRYDEAIEQAHKTLELDPDYVAACRILGWAYEELGRHAEAIETHRKTAALSSGSPAFKGQLGRALALAGKRDEALRVLETMQKESERRRIPSLDIAILHAALGDTDHAFEWLVRACDEHSEHVPYLKVNPRLDSLRSDPRFDALLTRLGLGA